MGKGHWDRTEQYLRGAIDELRIYNRALSAEEIEALYQENARTAEVRYNTRKKNGILLYPNPAEGVLHYDGLESGLEMEGLSPGVYHVGFRTAGQIIHLKLIIQGNPDARIR